LELHLNPLSVARLLSVSAKTYADPSTAIANFKLEVGQLDQLLL
jgi:hypothetical protein